MGCISTALGGMDKAQSAVENVAGRLAKAGSSPVASTDPNADTVDLSPETLTLLQARNEFQTNARVINVGDNMQKTLLNLLA